MTGAQEQKMKAVCWELAMEDYEYRFIRFSQNKLGECSSYKEKDTVYLDVIGALKKIKQNFSLRTSFDRDGIVFATLTTINNLFAGVNLSTWDKRTYLEFIEDLDLFPAREIVTNDHLLAPTLVVHYQLLYNHRDRCAHNTLSTKENFPTLKVLLKGDRRYDNYFVRFALLILIDMIFIQTL